MVSALVCAFAVAAAPIAAPGCAATSDNGVDFLHADAIVVLPMQLQLLLVFFADSACMSDNYVF